MLDCESLLRELSESTRMRKGSSEPVPKLRSDIWAECAQRSFRKLDESAKLVGGQMPVRAAQLWQ